MAVEETRNDGPLRIDLKEIVRSRHMKIPGPAVSVIEKIIHQKGLNAILEYAWPAEGSAFASKVYEFLDLSIEAEGLDRIPPGGRYVFASNHPLGGLDGIGLVKILGERYGDDNIRVLVNDMLMNVKPMSNVFLPVNKFGAQQRRAAELINKAYASDRQIVMFPAGLVSRMHPGGRIGDLEWQKSFVSKAVSFGRMIVPVRFEGLNRRRFYNAAKWRSKLRIGVNLEQILLPAEVFASRGKSFRVIFGEPEDPVTLIRRGLSLQQVAERFRALVNPE